MPATTTLFRAARPVFQSGAGGFRNAAFRNAAGRRFQSTTGSGPAAAAAGAAEGAAAQQQSWFQRMWSSPVGLKTVHFWYV